MSRQLGRKKGPISNIRPRARQGYWGDRFGSNLKKWGAASFGFSAINAPGDAQSFTSDFIGPKHPRGYSFMGFGFGEAKGYNGWKMAKANKTLGRMALGTLLPPVASALTAYGTMKEEGIAAGVKEFAFWEVVNAGVGTAFEGGATAVLSAWKGKSWAPLTKYGRLLGSRAAVAAGTAAWLLPVAAYYGAAQYSLGKAQERSAKYITARHNSLGVGTAGNLAAFTTKNAWTNRQMAVQAIQRSHLNARSALGNEAQYMR